MTTKRKRFTISFPHEIEEQLTHIRNQIYLNKSKNEMINDLIERGLKSLEDNEQTSSSSVLKKKSFL